MTITLPVRCAVALVMALALGACTTATSDTPRAAPTEARPGGTLTVGIPRPGSVDPSNAYEPAGTLIARTMCDTLLAVDPATGELVPGLAESWLVSDDGAKITVQVRRDARFSDGSDIGADDVAFTLSRVASAEYAGLAAELLRPIVGFAEIRGEVETEDDLDRERLAGVRVLTEHSVEITLLAPLADFVRVLTHPATAPVPRSAVEADPDGFARSPVCVGPYRLREPWDPDATRITLERSPTYAATNLAYTGGGAGYPDTIEFHVLSRFAVLPDDGPGPAASPAPTASASPGPTGTPAAGPGAGPDPEVADPALGRLHVTPLGAEQLIEAGEVPATTVVAGNAPSIEFVGLPAGEGSPLANRGVRVALSQALDREELVRRVFRGARVPATGFLPPTLGPDLHRDGACRRTTPVDGDIDAARAALDAAGVDLRALRIPLYVNDDFANVALAEELARQWERAFGVTFEVVALPWTEFLARAEQASGFDGAFRESWAAAYPSADAYLFPLFHTSAIGIANLSRYSDSDFDRGIERNARRAVDPEDLRLEYLALEDDLCRDLPLIPLAFDRSHYLVRRDVGSALGDILVDPSTGEPLLRELYVR